MNDEPSRQPSSVNGDLHLPNSVEALTPSEAAALWRAQMTPAERRQTLEAPVQTDAVPSFSESALTQRFVERHADELRFCAAWGKWLRWDGVRWERESTLLAFDRAHAICREAARESGKGGAERAASLASAHSAHAIQTLARADRSIAATVDQWDADPWLLNTPGGVVDLRTGEVHAADPELYLTRVTGAAPAAGACPMWRRFLERICERDFNLIAYLQRVLGYCLTGSVDEHVMLFAYGTGANGKSVLATTIAGIMGDYHRASAMETFTASTGDRHPTELPVLRGARFVTAIETEEGRRWAESRIKALTGGDTISARYMRQDSLDFRPQFKLFIAGNHKPGLQSVDEAIRRRFHLIRFGATIPEAERDHNLAERLRDEWPMILSWMIDGCRAWQERGLCAPDAVTSATANYLVAEDVVGCWVRECCEPKPGARTGSGPLYQSWRRWAAANGEQERSQRWLGDALEARGFVRDRTGRLRFHKGLHLR